MTILKRWFPAIVLMATIFGFSSIPSTDMPSFGLADSLVKKGGHAFGYALLALAYRRGLGGKRSWLPWLMAVLFSATDEFHQSFVPGRHSSLTDVLVFDNLGALAGLVIFNWFNQRKSNTLVPPPPKANI